MRCGGVQDRGRERGREGEGEGEGERERERGGGKETDRKTDRQREREREGRGEREREREGVGARACNRGAHKAGRAAEVHDKVAVRRRLGPEWPEGSQVVQDPWHLPTLQGYLAHKRQRPPRTRK